MKVVNIGLLGIGTVGGGMVSVLSKNRQEIINRLGFDVVIKQAATRSYDPKINGLNEIGFITDDTVAVVDDPDIDIIVELIGGVSVAKDLILRAIDQGKHIVTANKALIALHGNELFAKSKEKKVSIFFEAAVAGGIPVIKALREGLVANRIESIVGIINGTGNYILTEMHAKGRDFDAVLKEAQALGYAEADPTFDVEGVDAAHKLTILSALAFGTHLAFKHTYTEGISGLNQIDILYADELGYTIKHLGIARKTNQGIEQRVHPALIPKHQLLANVDGVMNAVLIAGNAVGKTIYYGAGAGSDATASAVLADVIDAIRATVPCTTQDGDASKTEIDYLSVDQIKTAYYLRFEVEDLPGVLAGVTQILADFKINIRALLQKENPDSSTIPVIILTQKVQEYQLDQAIIRLESLSHIYGKVVRIRVEHFD